MSRLRLREYDHYLAFEEAECRELGGALAEVYRSARPFPHIVIDDFLDKLLLGRVRAAFPSTDGARYFDRDQERLKFQFHANESQSGLVRNLLAELNGQAFLNFLGEMTGIQGLIPDPYFSGGGLHLTKPGGHLGVHADFNLHAAMRLERRLNLLIYLNDDWSDQFGGELEFWDQSMEHCEQRVAPLIGRAVVFSTNADSFHGHPDPLTCPPDRDRRSIATYYYTALKGPEIAVKRSTVFRIRPDSADRPDRSMQFNHLINDWIPPRLQRFARRLNPFQ